MEFVNLTPHPVHLVDCVDCFPFEIIEPSGEVARLKEREVSEVIEDINDSTVGISTVEYSEVDGLPDETPATLFIVSLVVALARPDRKDLIFPYPLVRDENGRVIGSSGFGRIG